MEQNELNKSNKIKIIVLTALIFLVAIAGISYAYFTIQIVGNETASSMRLTTANLSLVYNDVQIVSGENVIPRWSQTKTLTVYNDGNQTVYYNIIWRDLYNEITNNELVISATCSSSSGSCNDISETVIPTETTEAHNIKVKNNIEIPVGVTHTYTVTVTFKETGSNQNYNQNKEFYGTLNIAEGSASATLSLQTDTGTTGLSTGDTVRATKSGIDNQDFYVVSTNASETVLLAKYNLLVGDIIDVSGSGKSQTFSLNKTLGPSDSGYGLQSSTAKGLVEGNSQYIGVVPFSGTNYWDDGNGNLVSPYNANGASYSGSPYPYVYNSNMSNTSPSIDNYEEGFGLAQNNGYTIAYYVEEYINTLGINGIGRLLTVEEVLNLGCTIGKSGNCDSAPAWFKNNSTFWLGSAYDDVGLWIVDSDGNLNGGNGFGGGFHGVRPVIIVSTSNIQSN